MTNTAPIFTPFTLNNSIEIKNRLVVAPMTHYTPNPDGTLSDEERAFLTGRSDDFGLFITAATLVHPSGKAFVGQPSAYNESHLASLTKTASIIKKGGAKAIDLDNLNLDELDFDAMLGDLADVSMVGGFDSENDDGCEGGSCKI